MGERVGVKCYCEGEKKTKERGKDGQLAKRLGSEVQIAFFDLKVGCFDQ